MIELSGLSTHSGQLSLDGDLLGIKKRLTSCAIRIRHLKICRFSKRKKKQCHSVQLTQARSLTF